MLKNIILNNVCGPTKLKELLPLCRSEGFSYEDVVSEVKQLAYEGLLIEISYVIPNGKHGEQVGILFPKGTEVFQRKPRP